MPRLSIWNSGKFGNDAKFIDRSISEFFGIGGTAVLCHLYLGPYLQTTEAVTTAGQTVAAFDPSSPAQVAAGITTIEDPLLLENRDRKYATNTIELRGIYNLSDLDFDLKQFGLFLSNDTQFIEFHLRDMIARCGRKLMPGDVLELPHRRDTGLDPSKQIAANKFYVIEDASRASDGYSATWWPHIWRCKVVPMPAGQEYNDILNAPATNPLGLPVGGIGATSPTLADILATGNANTAINEAVDTQAKIDVPQRYFETQQYYMQMPELPGVSEPWIFAGDGVPPNGATLLGSGTVFPLAPNTGDYYLRTDYQPETLFLWDGKAWRWQESNCRPNWTAANNVLINFINNDAVTHNADGTTAPEKVNLSRAVMPRADF